MSQILKEFISPNGQIVEDAAGGMIVLIDRLPYVNKALDVVKLFDASAEGKERRSLNDKQTNSKRVMTEQDTADLAQLESQR